MALKYWLQYNDVVSVTHRLELDDAAFIGTSTEVFGTVFYDYGRVDDVLECFRGSGLKVELEANSTITFNDLFTEEERKIKATYIRSGQTKFIGWLNPEGWYEDFVADKWKVSFDIVDGLSYLADLSYVDNTTGFFFTGKQSGLEIVVNCLKRTGLQLNINTDINIEYPDFDIDPDTSLPYLNPNILVSTYYNSDRFVKDDGATIMSCEEVIKSVLEEFTACITMKDGEWYIFRPNQVASSATYSGMKYDYTGAFISTVSFSMAFTLGSQINGFNPHHVNSNQQISNKKSLGALRINYKYGLAERISFNNKFIWISNSLTDWTINSTTYLYEPSNSIGVEFDYGTNSPILSLTSASIPVKATDKITYQVKATVQSGNYDINYTNEINIEFYYKLILNVSGTLHYLQYDDSWSTTNSTRFFDIKGLLTTIVYINDRISEIPFDGNLYIEIWSPFADFATGKLLLEEFTIMPINSTNLSVKGEFHTFQRVVNPSSKAEKPKTVYVGDIPSALYVGTIYKNDAQTPTNIWNRSSVIESIPLLRLMGNEIMRIKQSTSKVFSGDVFGYFNYLSRVQIDGITGIFIPTSFNYDTKRNIVNAEFTEVFNAELTDVNYEVTYDYGTVTKPTIN